MLRALQVAGFGDRSIDVVLFACVGAMDKGLRMRDELCRDIERARRGNGIGLPFPKWMDRRVIGIFRRKSP